MMPDEGLELGQWLHDRDAFLRRLRLAIALGPRRELRYGRLPAGAPSASPAAPPAAGVPGGPTGARGSPVPARSTPTAPASTADARPRGPR